MSEMSSLVFQPITNEQFFAEYFEKRVLHVERNREQYFDDLLSLTDIDAFIASSNPHYPNVNLRKKGGDKAHQPWLVVPSLGDRIPVDKELLYKGLAEGQTLILNAFQHKLPKLHQFLNKLGNSWSIGLSANIYVTPAGHQGFEWHYDNHDVLVLQTEGSKEWEILHETPFLPDVNYKGQSTPPQQTDQAKQLTMNPGDILYIPRGIYHKAVANETSSVHITVGMYTKKVYDLIDDFMTKAQLQRGLRKSWNVFEQTGDEQMEMIRQLKQFAVNYFDQLESDIPESIANQKVEKAEMNHGRLTGILVLNQLSERSKVRTNGSIKWEMGKKFIELSFQDKSFKYPIFMKDTVLSILDEDGIRLGDLKGEVSFKHKAELARKFVTEGLLVIEEV